MQTYFYLALPMISRIWCIHITDFKIYKSDKSLYHLQYARNVTELLDTLLDNYHKDIRPDFEDDVPTNVNIDIAVRSMGPISEQDMCYSMDCYFRQTWKDSRLKFNSQTENALSLGASMLDKIWKPDTYFWNGQDSYLHKITVPNRFIRLKQDGTVQYSSRRGHVPMKYHTCLRTHGLQRGCEATFPLDAQSCPLLIGSYAYQAKDVVYIWGKGINQSVTANADLELSQYVLKTIVMGFANGTREGKEGEFSLLTIHFHLDRHIGYFLINFYVPCTLIVVLSWVAFWINREATADRIGLGATSILTMTFMAQDSKQDLPKVTYATALDIYMVLCYAFVLLTIVEFSLVHAFTKFNTGDPELRYLEKDRIEEIRCLSSAAFDANGDIFSIRSSYTYPPSTRLRRRKYPAEKEFDSPQMQMDHNINLIKKLYLQWTETGRKECPINDFAVNSTSSIDRVARKLFPFSFTFISIIYWYTYWKSE